MHFSAIITGLGSSESNAEAKAKLKAAPRNSVNFHRDGVFAVAVKKGGR